VEDFRRGRAAKWKKQESIQKHSKIITSIKNE